MIEAAREAEFSPVDQASRERAALEASPSSRCLNCRAELPGDYCPGCGQKDQPLRQPVHQYLVTALSEYLGLDGRVWPSLGSLLFKPGRLTQAYVLGKRQQYVRPLRLYITSSLLFFFLLALIDPVGRIRAEVDGVVSPDSTVSASAYLVSLDERAVSDARAREEAVAKRDSLLAIASGEEAARVDSLAALGVADSVTEASAWDGLTASALASVREELEETREEIAQDSVLSVNDRRRAWLGETVRDFPPDSLVRPADLQQAAELLIREDEGDFVISDIDFGGTAYQEFNDARTTQARANAGWALGRQTLRRAPTAIFLLLPFFALFMKVLYVRRGWYYSEHLVFALHVHAFAFAVFSLIAVLIWVSGAAEWSSVLASLMMLLIPLYFVLAQKRVYAQGWVKTLLKTAAMGWLYGLALIFAAVLAVVLAAAMG